MKILFVCHRLPYPPNRGGKIRPFNMIRHLGQRHSVTVVSLAHTAQELAEGSDLKQYCEEVVAEILPDSLRWSQAVKALLTPTPSSVAYFWSAQLYNKIKERLHNERFHVIWVHCAFVAQYVKNCRNSFRVLDFGDMDSAKWSEYSRWGSFPLSVGYAIEAAKLRRYERYMAGQFHRCTVTTQGEIEAFQALSVATPCFLIPNGVDTTYFAPNRAPGVCSRAIVFVGRMDYFPNIDGITYFAREILPIIRHKRPEVELRIVGSNPTKSVQQLAKLPNVLVTGHVPDVRPYLKDAAVSIAPLRIARGTQNKILESMAAGIPVVATPEAVKGVQVMRGRDIFVAEDSHQFAEMVIDLLTNNELRRVLSEAGRRQVEKTHAWPRSMQILDEIIADKNRPPGYNGQ
jgi:sugar transferase (PEP-CTERM/EpsH1 system associated)